MTNHPLHQVAIVGVYNTGQARSLPGETSASLALEATLGALRDAGLTQADVDGLNITQGVGYPSPPPGYFFDGFNLVGNRPCWLGTATFGIDMVMEAAFAIAAGLCTTVVVANGQAGTYSGRGSTAPWTRPSYEFTECWGLYTAAEFALIAQRHMAVYNTKPEQLAEVASAIRTNGSRHPLGATAGGGAVTPEDVLNSRMIADPFHLLDCSLTTEGGAGLVITSIERSLDLPGPKAYLLGGADETRGTGYARPPLLEDWGWVGEHAARRAFGMAGITPFDVDVCELYDPFSFEIIHQFEAFGFCAKGEGGEFVMDGRIRPGGQFPICTDGGLLSFSHNGQVQMLQRVIEAVHQVRGTAQDRQVPGARIALASNNAMAIRNVLLLASEPTQ